jgi:hypothetical protein
MQWILIIKIAKVMEKKLVFEFLGFTLDKSSVLNAEIYNN